MDTVAPASGAARDPAPVPAAKPPPAGTRASCASAPSASTAAAAAAPAAAAPGAAGSGLLQFRPLLVLAAPVLAVLAAEQRSCCQGPVYFVLYFAAVAFGARGLRGLRGASALQGARELGEDLLSSLFILGVLAAVRGGAQELTGAHAHAHAHSHAADV